MTIFLISTIWPVQYSTVVPENVVVTLTPPAPQPDTDVRLIETRYNKVCVVSQPDN